MQSSSIAKRLTIVTTTRNCLDVIHDYVASVGALDSSKFDWIVVDAASTDGTLEYLQRYAEQFRFFSSEPDQGTYYGLNKAIAQVRTPYYVVLGADDTPSPSLLEDVQPLLAYGDALILGAVRLMPSGRIKRSGRRDMHAWSWGRVISHHSVGTLIRTDLHAKYGAYDTSYRIVADGAFLKRILVSSESVRFTNIVFGDYFEGGASAQQHLRSLCECFLVQVQAGSSLAGQVLLLSMRLWKVVLLTGLRSLGAKVRS